MNMPEGYLIAQGLSERQGEIRKVRCWPGPVLAAWYSSLNNLISSKHMSIEIGLDNPLAG